MTCIDFLASVVNVGKFCWVAISRILNTNLEMRSIQAEFKYFQCSGEWKFFKIPVSLHQVFVEWRQQSGPAPLEEWATLRNVWKIPRRKIFSMEWVCLPNCNLGNPFVLEIHHFVGEIWNVHYAWLNGIWVICHRKDVSKACWRDEMGMAEVLEHKGHLFTSMGIIHNGKVYCSIEEAL